MMFPRLARVSSVLLAAAVIIAGPAAAVALANPPTVVGRTPTAAASGTTKVSVTFAEPVADPPISSISVSRKSDGSPIAGTTTSSEDDRTLTWSSATGTLSDGDYVAEYTARAASGGDTASGSFDFTVDATPPAVPTGVTVSPVNSLAAARSVTVSGLGDAGERVRVTIDDADATTAPVSGTGTIDGSRNFAVGSLNVEHLREGTLGVEVLSFDAVGNESAKVLRSVTKDTLAPVLVSTTPPVEGGSRTRKTVVATYNEALDTAESRITVTNKFGNALAGARTWSDSNKTLTFTATDDMTPVGSPYRVTLSVQDLSGKVVGASYGFVIDDTAPSAPTVAQPPAVSSANANAVTFSGSAEPASTVTVTIDDAVPGEAVTRTLTADRSTGAWTASDVDVRSLRDGTATVSATAKDVAGNTSSAAQRTFTKDTVAPVRPTDLTMTNPVNNTNQTAVKVTGTVEPGSVARIAVDDSTAGDPVETSVTGDVVTGAFTKLVDVTPLADGTITASVVAIDPVGNASVPGTVNSTKDALVPFAPVGTITDPINNANKAAVVFSGTAEPGTQVELTVSDGTKTSTPVKVSTSSEGAWSNTFDMTSYADGTITATARAIDSAKNNGATLTLTALKDATVPARPVLGGSAWASGETDEDYVVSGTAERSAQVTVTVAQSGKPSKVVELVASPAAGDFSTVVDVRDFNEGSFTITAVATDAVGNPSSTATKTVTKDTIAPARATVSVPTSPITSTTQSATLVTGTAEAGSSVLVTVKDELNQTKTATATADGLGNFEMTFDLTGMADNYLTVTAVATDPAGNRGPVGTAAGRVVKDTTTLAVSSTAPADNGRVRSAPTVTVVANQVVDQAKSTIVVRDSSNAAVSGTLSPATGDKGVVFTPSVTLNDAASPYRVTATLEDYTGEKVTRTTTFVVDVTPPAAPAVTSTPALVNAASASSAAVSGTAEPGSTVTVSVDDATAGDPVTAEFPVSSSGAWSGSVDVTPLADGTLTLTARTADVAGNISPASAERTFVKDATPPAAPSVTLPARIDRTNRAALPVTGSTEPGAALTVSLDDATEGDAVIATATVDEAGNWSATVDVTALADGDVTARAIAVDAAGNPSVAGTASTVKDTTRAASVTLDSAKPKSGSATTARVRLHRTSDTASPTDENWTGSVALTSSGDSRFQPGTCGLPVDGVSTCTGVVFGDLGAAVLTATVTTTEGVSSAVATAMVQPVQLAWAAPVPATARRGAPVTLSVRPVAGVAGADVTNYAGTPRVYLTGDAGSVANGAPLTCASDATCSISMSFAVGGQRTVEVVDDSTPPAATPKATITVADPARVGLVAPRTITYGQTHSVWGSVVNGRTGAPIAGAAVKLYARSYPSTTYSYVRTVTTKADGTYSTTFRPARTTVYRAVFEQTATLDGAAVLRGLWVNWSVTVRTPSTSTSSLRAGSVLRVTGYIRPGDGNRTVALVQRRADGRMVTVATARTARDGSYVLSWRPGRGTQNLRVVAVATCCNTAGVSRTFAVRVA